MVISKIVRPIAKGWSANARPVVVLIAQYCGAISVASNGGLLE